MFRFFMLFIAFFMCLYFFEYIKKVTYLENKIFNLYSNNFDEYLICDENYILKIDKEKMINDYADMGYEIVFYDNIHFKVAFDFIFNIEKEYYFYMVINDE